jgi:hypothetical protein
MTGKVDCDLLLLVSILCNALTSLLLRVPMLMFRDAPVASVVAADSVFVVDSAVCNVIAAVLILGSRYGGIPAVVGVPTVVNIPSTGVFNSSGALML